MPDRRVPRGSKVETPGGEGTDYPLNDGGVSDYREEQQEQRLLEEEIKKRNNETGSPKRLDSGTGIGGFGVKPITDILSNTRRLQMSHSEKFITLSYADVLEFIAGDSILAELIEYVRVNEEYLYNPPTREELGHMLKFAVRRESGKIDSEDIPSAEARASGRVLSSPSNKKEYADPKNMAFPVDTMSRTRTAHAYIHKYWDSPSKKGVTATYGREDFIKAHKKIIAAMKKFGVEHTYLDGLDDASGVSKKDNEHATSSKCDKCEKEVIPDVSKKPSSDKCEKCGEQHDKCKCKPTESCKMKQESAGQIFRFHEGQAVVSFSHNRMQEKGTIIKIDGTVASVQWESNDMATTELLAGLIPSV